MQIQTQQLHKNAHISMPTEEGLEDLRQAILLARNNPKLLAFLEAEIPPHIMEAVVKYSQQLADREEQLANEAEALADEAEQFYKEAKSLRIQMQNLRQSIKKRMDSQQQKPTNS